MDRGVHRCLAQSGVLMEGWVHSRQKTPIDRLQKRPGEMKDQEGGRSVVAGGATQHLPAEAVESAPERGGWWSQAKLLELGRGWGESDIEPGSAVGHCPAYWWPDEGVRRCTSAVVGL